MADSVQVRCARYTKNNARLVKRVKVLSSFLFPARPCPFENRAFHTTTLVNGHELWVIGGSTKEYAQFSSKAHDARSPILAA